jgi:hypothetical protein
MIILADADRPGDRRDPPDVRDIKGGHTALIYPFVGGCG